MANDIVRANLRMLFHALVTQAQEEYSQRCAAEFAKLAASEGLTELIRVSVMQDDGGCFRQDFDDWQKAARMFNGNVRYGSPLLVVCFEWNDKLGWQEFTRYPTH